ncbi:helix-turn-helix domain-containing protein [Streptomyces sp. NPDC055103]
MHALPSEHIGRRIARLRKAHGLTQKQLCEIAPSISYSTLTKTEQGVLPATPALIAMTAKALRIPVAQITGQPYEDALRADEVDVLIRPIREALDCFDIGPDSDLPPRTTAVLHAEAEELCAAVRAGEIKHAATRVAGLIEEATAAAHTNGTSENWANLASLYRTAYDVATKLGYADLAQLSIARLEWAAEKGSNPILGGMAHYLRSLTYLREGNFRTGQRLITMGLGRLDQADEVRERNVVIGQLHLGASVMAGRARNSELAHEHLAEAEQIASQTGEAVKVHWLAFGQTNVQVHRVAVLAELDKYAKAVQASRSIVIPKDWPKSRTSHHFAEVARAQLWTGQLDGAFENLVKARKVAPQQAKHHPTVRETYAGLEAAHRRLPDSFLSYGTWLGVPTS